MSVLPQSFSYFANKLAGVSRKNLKITPNNSTSIKQNENATFVLPTDSIVDLTTLQMVYNFKYQNAPAGGVTQARYVPAPHQLFRSVTWTINNQAVAGSQNQNFAQVYEALRVASTGNDNVNSRLNEYNAPPIANLCSKVTDKLQGTGNERVASNTVSRRCKMSDFLGLQTSPNAMSYDTAICGETRVEIQFNGNEVALIQSIAAPDSADADWEITDVHMCVDVISFASAEYDNMISQLLESEGSLVMPYNEITSQKSLLDSNIRFNVASSSLDMLGFALLKSTYNSLTHKVDAAGNAYSPQDFTDGLVPAQTQLCFRLPGGSALPSAQSNMSDSITATWYFTINGQVYPQQGATKLIDGAEYTKNLYASGKDDYNQLFLGASTAPNIIAAGTDDPSISTANNLEYAKQYKRVNYLERNCFVGMRTCLDVPAAQSPNHTLSGINTLGQSSQISLNLNGFNNSVDYALMIGQGSSVLQIGAGQQIAVVN